MIKIMTSFRGSRNNNLPEHLSKKIRNNFTHLSDIIIDIFPVRERGVPSGRGSHMHEAVGDGTLSTPLQGQ